MIPLELTLVLCLWCLLLGSWAGGWTTQHDGWESHRENIRQHLRWNLVATVIIGAMYAAPRIWP